MDEFAKFLLDNKDKSREERRLFFASKKVPLFTAQPNQPPLFFTKSQLKDKQRLSISDALVAAEARLGDVLPTGYKSFLNVLGPGIWCEATILHPDNLYDCELPQGIGEIMIAYNVDGCGNSITVDPKDGRIYFLAHDPTGYALVGTTFEEWIHDLTDTWLKEGNCIPSSYDDNFVEFSFWPRNRR